MRLIPLRLKSIRWRFALLPPRRAGHGIWSDVDLEQSPAMAAQTEYAIRLYILPWSDRRRGRVGPAPVSAQTRYRLRLPARLTGGQDVVLNLHFARYEEIDQQRLHGQHGDSGSICATLRSGGCRVGNGITRAVAPVSGCPVACLPGLWLALRSRLLPTSVNARGWRRRQGGRWLISCFRAGSIGPGVTPFHDSMMGIAPEGLPAKGGPDAERPGPCTAHPAGI